MAPMALALILGWWLVAASRAQQLPPPSLSLHPSQGIEVGDNVTLRCHLPRPAAWVQLCQEGGFTPCMKKYDVQDMAVFSFAVTKWVHTGTYRCQYRASEPAETSEKSDPVELVVTDHCFSPPGISVSPTGRVGMGANITIRCRNSYQGATFLHKDGHSAPIQQQDSDGGGTATFTLFGVTPADTGTYRCSYHPKGYPFLSSPLGESVTLEVTPTPALPGGGWSWEHPNSQTTQHPMGESHGNLVLAVLRVCAAALVFSLGVFFVLSARNLWVRRDGSPAGEKVK
uniref:Immunoglobulin domain-containing protein n=2 Tax=Meleagris gallopavo TaxID=9103 RepID=A0A803YFD7_MELGA